jgi:hypothetical protein
MLFATISPNYGGFMRLLFAVILLTTQAFATDWSDLEVGKTYKLTQSFQLKQTERSGSMLDIVAGQKVELRALIPLSIPGASLALYIFDYKKCPGPEMKTEQEIIPVNNTNPLVEAGVLLDTSCELNVYIELKDYYANSLFVE